jgi:hypothetical protein
MYRSFFTEINNSFLRMVENGFYQSGLGSSSEGSGSGKKVQPGSLGQHEADQWTICRIIKPYMYVNRSGPFRL